MFDDQFLSMGYTPSLELLFFFFMYVHIFTLQLMDQRGINRERIFVTPFLFLASRTPPYIRYGEPLK